MLKKAIGILMDRKDLDHNLARAVMKEIMTGNATDAQMGALLVALSAKGETIDEITAFAEIMRQECNGIKPKDDVLEIVGTGGDRAFTFNISTVSAFVVSACGVKVAKHGNRSVSSKCGSADVLEALGVKLDITKERCLEVLNKTNMCFMFAPLYHTGMKYAGPIRAQLGVRTVFNILGPLANPAGARLQLLGVYDSELLVPMASVLRNLGVKRAMVVNGCDGLDELTLTGSSRVCEVCEDGQLNSFFLSPEQLGLSLCKSEDLVGGDAKENAKIAMEILQGKRGAKRDIVVLNSAMCVYMASKNKTLQQCVEEVSAVIDSGKGLKKLYEFVKVTNE